MDLLPELVSYLEGLPEPHILFDRHYRILAANRAYRDGFPVRAGVIGRTCYEVSHHFSVPCDQAGESCPLAQARESGRRERVLHLHHTPRGEEHVQIELVPLRNAQGELAYFIEKMEPLRIAQGEPAARGLVGRSPAFVEMLALIGRVAPSSASVLLLGESGTGKELVARAVHEASTRAARALVVVDCASLPETLFESELFGHERGAFTGANQSRPGLVEAASGGTLFLDEVGDIPLPMQVKLLRLLESGTYRRVGSTELRHADLRVVAATHRDLPTMLAEGRFRQDLYYRLATFPIRLPPLRERPGDLPLLCEALLARVAPRRGLHPDEAALALLARQRFAGNVRELRNVLERAALLCDGPTLGAADVQRALQQSPGLSPSAVGTVAGSAGFAAPGAGPVDSGPHAPAATVAAAAAPGDGRPLLRELERQALREQVQQHAGGRAELARQLGISERTLYRKLARLRSATPPHPEEHD